MQSNMIFQERSAIQKWTNFIWNEIGITLQFPHGAYHQKFISPDQTSLSKGATRLRLLCEKSHNNCAYPKMHIESARYRFYAGLISRAFINYRARGSQAAAVLRKKWINRRCCLCVDKLFKIQQRSAPPALEWDAATGLGTWRICPKSRLLDNYQFPFPGSQQP